MRRQERESVSLLEIKACEKERDGWGGIVWEQQI